MKGTLFTWVLAAAGSVFAAAPLGERYRALWNDEVNAAIDRRIERHRKADCTVRGFRPGSVVKVEQVASEFQFGANMFLFDQLGSDEMNRRYRAAFGEIFNAATIPFYWKAFEPERGLERFSARTAADTAAFWNAFDFAHDNPYGHVEYRRPAPEPLMAYCEANGIAMHGHALVYMAYIPAWLNDAKWSRDEMEGLLAGHIRSIAAKCRGRIGQWDVVNESTGRDGTCTPSTPNDDASWYVRYGKIRCPMPKDYTFKSFKWAAEAFPPDVKLSLNDAWPTNQCYAPFAKSLVDRGAKIDVVGLQKHVFKPAQLLSIAKGETDVIPSGTAWAPATQIAQLRELDRAGRPIHISEITIPSPRGLEGLSDDEADAIQARVLTDQYRLWFSWPSVYRITYWNLVDGTGAKNEILSSGFFNRDMSEKAAAKAIRKLVRETWRTNLERTADKSGAISFRGFRGRYRITGTDREGRACVKEVTVTGDDPVVIEAGPEWIPVKDMDASGPVAGGALDFSSLYPRVKPCGRYGRLRAKGPHFEFERLPGVPQRFYGVNLCFSANFLSHDEADRFVGTLVRMGYNALRIHHHDSILAPDAEKPSAFDPESLDRLDYLLAKCGEEGVFVTTDFFVSRGRNDARRRARDFKQMIFVDEAVAREHETYVRAFMEHRNAYNGLRYADDPTLAFIAIVNEGNPGNSGYATFERSELWRKAWGREFPKGGPKAQTAENHAFFSFLAEKESALFARFRDLIRKDIRSEVLLSNMSCWTNPLVYQKPRTLYDYVDDHFYSEHPRFLGKVKWDVPVDVGDVNWFRSGRLNTRLMNTHRLADKPFTITEANFPAPCKWRSMGGLVLGCWAALQDWDAAWHFAWAHRRENLVDPRSQANRTFDVALDPLMQSGDRATIALFLRGDLAPLSEKRAWVLPPERLGRWEEGHDALYAWMGWSWTDWYVRNATFVGDRTPEDWKSWGKFPDCVRRSPDSVRAELFSSAKPGEWPRAGDGHIDLDPAHGAFAVSTARLCGGFAETGTIRTPSFRFDVGGVAATAFALSLDGQPLERSRRILVSHLTDVQQTGATYSDRTRKVLTGWGSVPRLMRAATGRCAVAIAAGEARVYALDAAGNRLRTVPSVRNADGFVEFDCAVAADPSAATWEYELEVR